MGTEIKPRLTLEERAAAYVSKMDAAVEGNGGDRQTFIVACKLVEFGLCSTDAMKILLEYNQRCQPPWSEEMLSRKLKCAFRRASPDARYQEPLVAGLAKGTPKWPKFDASAQARASESGVSLSDLYDLSPERFSSDKPATVEILQQLFPGNPLVCCGKSSQSFWTKPLSDYGHSVEFFQFVVPSPMSALVGKIQDPEPDGPTESAHTKDNTGERRFAVVEFDKGSTDQHASLLWHLSSYAPFVMAVHSGGKSLHGWFYVEGSPEDRVFRFYRYAVSLGADRATFLKSQFVRMPDGTRSNGVRQCVYYFNPNIIPSPCQQT